MQPNQFVRILIFVHNLNIGARKVIKTTDYVGSLAKGLSVLEAFGNDATRLSVAEVAAKTGHNRATARRCLLTLVELGYAKYDGKYFSLTPRVLRLGTGALAAMPLPQIIQPWIDQLSDKIGESVSVSILDDTEIVYVARAAQRRVLSIGVMPGSRLPAHCTSMGLVLLASLPQQEAEDIIDRSDLSPRTVNSVTDRATILNRIGQVAVDGYALVDQEIELGLRSIAVPITSSHGRVEAAVNVGVSAPQRSADSMIQDVLPNLLAIQTGIRSLLR